MRRAFVSHSSDDDRFVAEMESFLRKAGFDDVFNDVSAIRPDEKFWPEIEKGIANCDSFVVVITAASSASEWVKREVEYARSLSKNVIPIWIEDSLLPSTFKDRDVIDWRPRTREERRFDISRIIKYAPADLIGREDETKLLSDARQKTLRLEKGRPHVLTLVALGGEGKTSLVAKWAAELAAQDWPGCEAAFAWSFYSQGTREQVAASSDLFLKEALNFFAEGHAEEKEIKAFAASPTGAFEKGQRLARIVGQRRSLLILDGLEPLQYAPTSPTAGQPKDQGIAALLKGLAAASHGLCLATTRYSLPDLRAFWQTTAPEVKLLRLSRAAGVHLLKTLEVRGSERRNIPVDNDDPDSEKVNEYEKLVEDVKGHALTLQIIGGFLSRAFGGDIRQRDRVKFEKADEKIDGGHAFRVMAAYAQWMEDGSDEARRELAILRCLGLFDRPATRDCLEALLQPPAIAGLTEPLVGVAQDDWQFSLDALDRANLLAVNGDSSGALLSLDTHPHIREYFSKQLREKNPDAWRAAHRRLYEHLCTKTQEGVQPTLEDLQPLYQAVAHGCQAGLQQGACDEVYRDRILRGTGSDGFYSTKKLGAFGSDLGAVACFFEPPWRRISPSLKEDHQAWLLNEAAVALGALGRLTEALEPMRAVTEMTAHLEDFKNAAIDASNLSELELTLGEVALAVEDAEQSVTYADRSGDAFQRITKRCTHADALHQAGRRAEAETRFREAEQMQQERHPDYPLLYALRGFQYCDLLLAAPERAAWQLMLRGAPFTAVQRPNDEAASDELEHGSGINAALQSCHAVSQRAQTLKWVEDNPYAPVLIIALNHLTLGRAALYEAILSGSSPAACNPSVADAVSGLRRAGQQDKLLHGLLTRAWLRFLTGAKTGPDSAQADLDEASEIAERGPMKLFMADIHLYGARLFGRETLYPSESPHADLAEARRLIEKCGYGRRKEELEDAEAGLRQQHS